MEMTYEEWKASGGWSRVKGPSLKGASVNRKRNKRSSPPLSGGKLGPNAASEVRR